MKRVRAIITKDKKILTIKRTKPGQIYWVFQRGGVEADNMINRIKQITKYIFIDSGVVKSDIALIFGTKYDEPVYEAVKLYEDGKIRYILFSGGINKHTDENEAQRMLRLAIFLGIPKEKIIIEDKSANTLENVLFSKSIIDKKFGLDNIKSMTAITKHYHSRRVLMTLKKHLPNNIKLHIYPYEQYGFTKDNWYKHKAGKERVLSEYEKISKYLAKSDIEELD